ncbi:terpene synthase family protein [Chitinophaga solisilvae]|uniref:terpene synthase family protein n=1 Tax=Chitinophaga solisilvae TaxID=1233460 RepID=UPI001369761E|nr:hypothetical protein [Chitinophaga solisilvae]
MPNHVQACITLPGKIAIHSSFESVQEHTLSWAQEFSLAPQFKSISWYTKARFGFQAAREYPDADYNQICLAGDLLTWLFTVDDACDRGSSDATGAARMKILLYEFIGILKGNRALKSNDLSKSLTDILLRMEAISTPFLYQVFCKHMIDYLEECFFEFDIQLHNYTPTIEKYFEMRPQTGFYIMFPLAAIFKRLNIPDVVYQHPAIQEIELTLSHLGCLSNDLHSREREQELEATGFNLIFIAERELHISHDEAIDYVTDYHDQYQEKLKAQRQSLPFWSKEINQQVDKYIRGVYNIIKGYDHWAVMDTNRYGIA